MYVLKVNIGKLHLSEKLELLLGCFKLRAAAVAYPAAMR